LGILSGNPKNEPLHYGEVFQLWSFSVAAKGAISSYQTFLNHAGDPDLKKQIEEMIKHAKEVEQDCDKLLLENEITPSPAQPDKPPANLADIPAGARFSDLEIAAAITLDNSMGLVAFSQAMSTCIREDVAALFAKHHAVKAAQGLKILRMNKEKGWLIPPPPSIEKAGTGQGLSPASSEGAGTQVPFSVQEPDGEIRGHSDAKNPLAAIRGRLTGSSFCRRVRLLREIGTQAHRDRRAGARPRCQPPGFARIQLDSLVDVVQPVRASAAASVADTKLSLNAFSTAFGSSAVVGIMPTFSSQSVRIRMPELTLYVSVFESAYNLRIL